MFFIVLPLQPRIIAIQPFTCEEFRMPPCLISGFFAIHLEHNLNTDVPLIIPQWIKTFFLRISWLHDHISLVAYSSILGKRSRDHGCWLLHFYLRRIVPYPSLACKDKSHTLRRNSRDCRSENIRSWCRSNGDIQFQIGLLSLCWCPVSHSSHLVDDTVIYLKHGCALIAFCFPYYYLTS